MKRLTLVFCFTTLAQAAPTSKFDAIRGVWIGMACSQNKLSPVMAYKIELSGSDLHPMFDILGFAVNGKPIQATPDKIEGAYGKSHGTPGFVFVIKNGNGHYLFIPVSDNQISAMEWDAHDSLTVYVLQRYEGQNLGKFWMQNQNFCGR